MISGHMNDFTGDVSAADLAFLAGGGEMGERMRTHDWARTALGPPARWPQSLRTAISICLKCSFPIVVLWGEHFVHFYNDEYRSILGAKHPALGKTGPEVWPEIWSTVGPMLEGVMRSGEATRARDLLLPMHRAADSGVLEDCYFSFSYSPIVDELGHIAGVFCPVIETTETVKAQRRLQDEGGRLRDLFAQAPSFMAVLEGPDHRFVLANETYQEIFGPRPLIGRSLLEAFPEIEGQGVVAILDKVRATGTAFRATANLVLIRRPGAAQSEKRYFDVVYQPIPDADGSTGGIFVQGVDISERIGREQRDACLKQIERLAHEHVDALEIPRSAARLLAEHLQADRCAYAEVDSDENGFTITGDYTVRLRSTVGRYHMSEFGAAALDHMHRGQPWIVDDCDLDPRLQANERVAYHAIQMQAVICVPLLRAGRFVACMAVHSQAPRAWHAGDVELTVAVADRCQESIERARIERELRYNEERFRKLVEATSQILWSADAQGQVETGSPSWQAFTGQDFAQQRGTGWLDALHPDDRRRLERSWPQAVARGTPVDDEYRLRHVDGSWRWTEVRAIPVRNADGTIREWVGMNTDVTPRKNAERRDAFLVRVDDAIRPLSDPDEIAFASMRMLCEELGADRTTYFEVDADQAIAHVMRNHAPHIRPLVGDHVIADYGSSFVEAMRGNYPLAFEDADQGGLTPDQRRRFVEVQAEAAIVVPLRKDDRLTAILGVYQGHRRQWTQQDIELTRLLVNRCWESIERARVARALQEGDRRKDEFIATLAHELRNPLAPLRNAMAVLTRGAPGISTERLFTMMERQVDHLVHMVDDLLDVSRITRGKIEIRRQRVDLVEVVRNAIDTSRPWIESARHRFEPTFPEQPVPVRGDIVRLTQIFANLLNNASKYTPEGGQIGLRVWTEAGKALVRVTDNGVGIAPEMRSRVFEIFAQVPAGQHRTGDGLGIGLSLVKSLVALHDGTVKVHSEGLGKGSSFLVSLPLAEASDAADAVQATTVAPPQRELRRVLVVDDNRDAADSIAMVLAALGADVRVAYDGNTALELIESYRPTVALLDIGMPEMDGYQLARRIRARSTGQQVILVALTGWGQEDDQRQSREAGFDRHLIKPVSFDVLKQVVMAV